MHAALVIEEARRLRREGRSHRAIAEALQISPSTSHAWTRYERVDPASAETVDAKRRKLRELRATAWAARARERRRQFQERGRRAARKREPLHIAGCMLYWAEGRKNKNSLRISNSDVELLRFFVRFLTDSLSVDRAAITIYVNAYVTAARSIEEIEAWWLDRLGLDRSALRGHTINHRPTSSSGRKENKLPFGVCTVSVLRSTEAVQHIFGAIQEYGGFDEPAWLG